MGKVRRSLRQIFHRKNPGECAGSAAEVVWEGSGEFSIGWLKDFLFFFFELTSVCLF